MLLESYLLNNHVLTTPVLKMCVFNEIYNEIVFILYHFGLILLSSLVKNTLIKHLYSVMRAPVRSSLANRGAEPKSRIELKSHLS